MRRQVGLFFALSVLVTSGSPYSMVCLQQVDPCGLKLPEDLHAKVFSEYEGYRLVSRGDLIPYHRELWEGGPKGCPGLAQIDIDGNGRVDFAFNLIRADEVPPGGIFMVALNKVGGWEIVELLRFDQMVPAVLWAEGETTEAYESYERDEQVRFPHGALLLVGYESWSRAYGIVDGEFRFIALSE